MPTYAYKKIILHDPINHFGTNCWKKNSFSNGRMTQLYNKNCYINRHVVLFLI